MFYNRKMRILKTFRFRLDLTAAQALLFAKTAGCCRLLYNLGLAQRSMAWHQRRKSVDYAGQAGELKALKAEFSWLKDEPHHCLQQALMDLQRAFGNFFKGRAGYPRRHKKFRRDSFRFPYPAQIKLANNRLFLPEAGWVECRQHREIEGALRSVTVSRVADHWYASLLCELEIPDPVPPTGPEIGIDLGIALAVTLSDGTVLPLPAVSKHEYYRQARLQRAVSRKVKGSGNRHKARRRLARFHAWIANRRRDAMHKVTTMLAKNHGRLIIEDLKIRNMTASAKGSIANPGKQVRQKAILNRALLDHAFGEFRRQLDYKARWYGSTVMAVNPAYTSQRCSRCGHTEAGNRPSQAVFCCLSCGYGANADHNAACNILAVGSTVTACGALA